MKSILAFAALAFAALAFAAGQPNNLQEYCETKPSQITFNFGDAEAIVKNCENGNCLLSSDEVNKCNISSGGTLFFAGIKPTVDDLFKVSALLTKTYSNAKKVAFDGLNIDVIGSQGINFATIPSNTRIALTLNAEGWASYTEARKSYDNIKYVYLHCNSIEEFKTIFKEPTEPGVSVSVGFPEDSYRRVEELRGTYPWVKSYFLAPKPLGSVDGIKICPTQ